MRDIYDAALSLLRIRGVEREERQVRKAAGPSPQLRKQELSGGLWAKQVLGHSNLVGSYIVSQRYHLSSFFYILSSFSFMGCSEALNHEKERHLIVSHSYLVNSQYQPVSYITPCHSCVGSDHLFKQTKLIKIFFSFHTVVGYAPSGYNGASPREWR